MRTFEEHSRHFREKGKQCIFNFYHMDVYPSEPGVTYCNSTFDSFSCWPTTKAGEVAEVSCPDLSIADPSVNATKRCFENGTWSHAEYSACMVDSPRRSDPFFQMYTAKTFSIRIIYDIGFSVSTFALVLALAIFLHFKSLRCLRNSIHCHLIIAFIFSNITWFVMHNSLNYIYSETTEWVCKLFVSSATYFHSIPFYWMFIEGLYLFTIIVFAFSAQKLRLWYYSVIAWGLPFLLTIVWSIVKENFETIPCWLHTGSKFDYIIHGPVLFLLASNVFFIVAIIWVLIIKMKASNSIENRQSRKAVKATVVLVPLLGLTYVLFLRPPFNDPVLNSIFQHINAVLQSTQGLFVAIFYCFMNGEVRTVLRQRLNSLQDSRTLSRCPKNGSPRHLNCYAVACNGRCNGNRIILQSKVSNSADPETEASALMMEKVESQQKFLNSSIVIPVATI